MSAKPASLPWPALLCVALGTSGLALLLWRGSQAPHSPRRATPVLVGGQLRLPPLEGKAQLLELEHSWVYAPLGATEPAPLLILAAAPTTAAATGAAVRRALAEPAFVLCPRFEAAPLGLDEARSLPALRRSLAELVERFGPYVDRRAPTLVGVGDYASAAISLMLEEPRTFAQAVLVMPPAERWSSSEATGYRQRGGQRVVLAASAERCDDAQALEERTRSVGLRTRLVCGASATTTSDELLEQALRESWPTLLGRSTSPP